MFLRRNKNRPRWVKSGPSRKYRAIQWMDLMRNIWFHVEILDVWLQTLVSWLIWTHFSGIKSLFGLYLIITLSLCPLRRQQNVPETGDPGMEGAALFIGSVTSGPLAPERDRGLQHWECQYHPSSSIFTKRAVSFVSGSRMSGPDGEWRFASSLLVLMHFFATGQEDAYTLLFHASLAVSPWDSRNQVRAASASTSGGHAPWAGHSSLPLLLHHGYLEFLLSWNGHGTMAHIGWLFPQFVIVFSALGQSLLFFG